MVIKIHFSPEPTLTALEQLLMEAGNNASCRGLLIFAAIANAWPKQAADQLLQTLSVPCIGGLFPALLYEKAVHHEGVLVIALSVPIQTRLIGGLNAVADLASLDFDLDSASYCNTLFAVVDGYAARTSSLVEQVYFTHGLQFSYIGGGAGALGQPGLPCVISNAGIHADALVLAQVPLSIGLGMAHGYSAISEPMQVTAASGNVIHSIDHEPAYSVYRRLVEQFEAAQGNTTLDWDDFVMLASRYPFGMRRINNKIVVRDPVDINDDGSIGLVGEVFDRSYLQLLTASQEQLLDAAERANALATGSSQSEAHVKLIFDCVSRFLLSGEDGFREELDKLFVGSVPTAGVLSIGEIANNGRDFLEFYNKTVVIGLL